MPFIFDGGSSNIAGFSSAQLEQASSCSPDLTGVPSVSSPSDSEVLEFPIVGGNSTPEGKTEKKLGDLKNAISSSVEPNQFMVHEVALQLVAKFPGDLTVDQICSIYSYMKKSWIYASYPMGRDYLMYANQSIEIAGNFSRLGVGDCNDFAILMSALVESIGGTTRIILAQNKTMGGHAYAEVYIGNLSDQKNQVNEIIIWLKQKFNTDKIYTHIDTDSRDVWLNLDWGAYENGTEHPGGPFYRGDRHIMVFGKEFGKTSLKVSATKKYEGELGPAIPLNITINTIESSSAKVWFNKGFALSTLGKDDEAIKAYDEAIRLDPKLVAAWNNKGYVLSGQGKHDEGLNAFDEAIRLDPNSVAAWFNKGVSLYSQTKYEEAIKAYDETIRLDPSSSLAWSAWHNKGVALNDQDKYDEAIKAFDEAIRLDPNLAGAGALVGKGYALDGLGRYDEAIDAYDEAIRLDQNFSRAWSNKGYALEKLGKYEEAINACNKAIEIDPQNKEAWNNKCDALYSQGKYQESIKTCDLAIQINVHNAGAWGNKGRALHGLGQDNEAINCFDKVLEIDQLDVNGWYSKGTVLMDLGKNNEAIQAFDKATELDANHSNAWNNKGQAFSNQERYDDAIRSYDRAIDINPQHPDAWLNKGAALFELERYNEALQAFNQAIKINPQDILAWQNIGLAFEALGRNVEADEAFRKAKELDLGIVAVNAQVGSGQSSVRSEKITGTGSIKKDYYIENKANDSVTVSVDIKNANYYQYTYHLYSDEIRSTADLDIVVEQAENIKCSGNAKSRDDIPIDITTSIKNGNLTYNNFVASSDQGVQVFQNIIIANGDNIDARGKGSVNDSITIANNIAATYSEAFKSTQKLSVGRDNSTVAQINAITGPLNVSSYIAVGDRKLNAIADVAAGILSVDQAVNLNETNQSSRGVICGGTFDTITTSADRKKKRAYTEVGSGNLINLYQIASWIDSQYKAEYEYMPVSYQTGAYDLNLNSSKIEGI
jgi:tetratricopeptide (TPR) repeat protein